ncbi:lipase 3 [Manduca sexta]|uniref:lipase 3 n=1 Tax=Manduca sexta TaxID=7130 RepID=UPI0018902C48|nr:lipase 3 [Manduca sexta]
MKTVGLFLCLALAGASGSIFRRTPTTDGLIVQPLDYIPQQVPIYQQYQQTFDEYQNPEHNHHHEKQNHQHKDNHRHHSSSSSHSNSHESEETKERNSQEHTKSHHDSKYWKHFTFVKKDGDMVPVYGDPIVWKGLTIAIGPKSVVQKEEDIEKIFGDAEQIMKSIPEEHKAKFHEALTSAIKNDHEDAHLNATQLLQKHKYPVEEHIVKTDDGYHLTLFRIPPKVQAHDVVKKPVVMLMHGLLGSADDFLLQGPGKSLAYLLADEGYDVWLGNARGNKYSRHHVSKYPALNDFWKFSNDEIALHDLPAMIDHALQTSGQEKLHYIGHAQGTTTFFALASEKPEYNDKIITMHALAPMAYMTNTRSPLVRMIAPTSSFYERLHEQFGNGAFTPSKELVHTTGGAMCKNTVGCDNICSNLNYVMSGVDMEDADPEMIHVIMAHLPAGTSTRVIKHYGQGVASHEFRKYDYGTEMNKQVYGTPEPPKYDLQKVQTPVSLYFSEEDWLAHPKDVERLAKALPNVKTVHKVPEKHFTHMDFQFSKKAPETVYKKVMESMHAPTQ